MTLSGFNQEGGKVTGNIGKVEVISRQNTSTTTGSSKGMSVGVSSQGIPTSVNVNASRTNGNRAFVDNQSTFVVGEGSNLHVGTVENTGAVIGKEGNSTFKIDTYAGKDIQNYDTMTTTGGSIGASIIYFTSDKDESSYIGLEKNKNGLPILPIKIKDDNITATVRHETQHSNDKSTRLNEGKMKILKKME